PGHVDLLLQTLPPEHAVLAARPRPARHCPEGRAGALARRARRPEAAGAPRLRQAGGRAGARGSRILTMKTQQVKNIYAVTLILLDALLVGVAFILAYELRVSIPWPAPVENLAPLSSYLGLIGLQMVTTVAVLMFNRQYVVPRAVS